MEFPRGGLSITDLEKYGWVAGYRSNREKKKRRKNRPVRLLGGGPIVYRDRPRGWPTCARDGNRVVIGFIAIIVALVQIRGNVISPAPPGQTITSLPLPPPLVR